MSFGQQWKLWSRANNISWIPTVRSFLEGHSHSLWITLDAVHDAIYPTNSVNSIAGSGGANELHGCVSAEVWISINICLTFNPHVSLLQCPKLTTSNIRALIPRQLFNCFTLPNGIVLNSNCREDFAASPVKEWAEQDSRIWIFKKPYDNFEYLMTNSVIAILLHWARKPKSIPRNGPRAIRPIVLVW
jgi:hypothetical protein